MSTILVVDDEALIRKLISRMLEAPGVEIVEAGTACDAAAIMEQRGAEIDIALVDISLPDINGADLVDHWMEKHPALKAILISGYLQDDAPLTARRALYLQKPFTREGLLKIIEAARK